MELKSNVPPGPIEKKWDKHRFEMKLVNPANKRKYTVIVVGSGPRRRRRRAASLAELGYNVAVLLLPGQPAPRALDRRPGRHQRRQELPERRRQRLPPLLRHGQGRRLPLPRGERLPARRRSRVNIIDQCVAQGVPFAREYGGLLANRSFGGAQVSRTFYARGQTGQQLLLGAYQALERQIGLGQVEMFPRHEMLDLVVVDGQRARHRRPRPGDRRDRVARRPTPSSSPPAATATSSTSSTNAKGCNATAIWRAYKKGAAFANPCFTQIHPTCIPVTGDYQSKLTLMSESLRNDGRIWVPKTKGDTRPPDQIPEAERDYYLERKYPSFGNLAPRDIASRAAKEVCDEGRGVGPDRAAASTSTSPTPSSASASDDDPRDATATSSRCTSGSPARTRTRCRCASTPPSHYTMGGLWVDYNLMSTIPGLFVLGEANFSDHGANRLGASALMQGLADGYFIIPYTIGNYLARDEARARSPPTTPAFKDAPRRPSPSASRRLLGDQGQAHGRLVPPRARQAHVGALRHGPQPRQGLEHGARRRSPRCARSSGRTSRVPGAGDELNQSLEKAGRVADFLEFGELHVPRRARARRVLRRPLPRGAPDAGRRGQARRRAASATSPPGSTRARAQAAAAAQGAARRSRTSTSRSGATSDDASSTLTLHVWRQKDAQSPGALRRPTRPTDVNARHVVPRDARRRQRGPHRQGRGADRLRPRLPRGHLRHVRLRDQRRAARPARAARPPASSTCGSFKDGDDARRSSRGAPRPSRSSRT